MIDFRRPNPFMAAMFLDAVVARMDKNATKAAILDELIDQAATYCAILASNPSSLFDADDAASKLARDIALHVCLRVFQPMGIIRWAEAEARLRNGECWQFLVGGDQ